MILSNLISFSFSLFRYSRSISIHCWIYGQFLFLSNAFRSSSFSDWASRFLSQICYIFLNYIKSWVNWSYDKSILYSSYSRSSPIIGRSFWCFCIGFWMIRRSFLLVRAILARISDFIETFLTWFETCLYSFFFSASSVFSSSMSSSTVSADMISYSVMRCLSWFSSFSTLACHLLYFFDEIWICLNILLKISSV